MAKAARWIVGWIVLVAGVGCASGGDEVGVIGRGSPCRAIDPGEQRDLQEPIALIETLDVAGLKHISVDVVAHVGPLMRHDDSEMPVAPTRVYTIVCDWMNGPVRISRQVDYGLMQVSHDEPQRLVGSHLDASFARARAVRFATDADDWGDYEEGEFLPTLEVSFAPRPGLLWADVASADDLELKLWNAAVDPKREG